MLSTILLSELRVKVTDASLDYVGSVTIHEDFCDALGFLERQMVHIRNEETGVDFWTYVIRGHDVPPGTICINGAAAHLVKVGDIVAITAHGLLTTGNTTCTIPAFNPRIWDAAQNGFENIVQRLEIHDPMPMTWAHGVLLEYAKGKVHRPRVTKVKNGPSTLPAIYLDQNWANQAGMHEGEAVHVVNVTNGQRDILTLKYAMPGSQECAIHLGNATSYSTQGYGSRIGYSVGHVVIAMTYGYFSRESIIGGEILPLQTAFPFERPKDPAASDLKRIWDLSTKVLWDERALVEGLIDVLQLEPGMKILDCACGGTGFPGLALLQAGLDVYMSDASSDLIEDVKLKARKQQLTNNQDSSDTIIGSDIRQASWMDLPSVWGKEQFDVIICRGNALPFVDGGWDAPSMSHVQSSRPGYRQLVQSIKAIFDTLKPGGILYVDCLPNSDFHIQKDGSLADGTLVEVDWEFAKQKPEDERRQLWKAKVHVHNKSNEDLADVEITEARLSGLIIGQKELESATAYAGFGLFTEVYCHGESVFRSFRVEKPQKLQRYYDRQLNRYRRVWNENGRICLGLCDGIWPVTESEQYSSLARTQGIGAMVGPNLALQAYMQNKLRLLANSITSILDVGCGAGRSSLELAKSFPQANVTGCDLSNVNIQRAEEMASEEPVNNITFFHGNVQDIPNANSPNDSDTNCLYSVVWSEGALCHAPPRSRENALRTISKLLEIGGIFVLNDTLAGRVQPASSECQLHVLERLGFEGLWNSRQYMDILESVGLEVIEFVDLTKHQAKSYELLAAEAARAATDAKGESNSEAEQVFRTISRDYAISARTIVEGSLAWGLFVCRKSTCC